MAKQLNSNLTVNLSFSADTAKAKAQLKDLQQQLTRLSQSVTSDSANFTLTDDLKESVMAAQQLSRQNKTIQNIRQ